MALAADRLETLRGSDFSDDASLEEAHGFDVHPASGSTQGWIFSERRRERRWWTVRRAAAHVGGGPKEIYRAVRVGKLKAVRLNRRGDIRTLPEWVDEWMEEKRTDPLVM
jgi:hypothetical protein